MKNANYRKHNDRTLNSSTYHKKDGTPIRSILKEEAKMEIREAIDPREAYEADEAARFEADCDCGSEYDDDVCYECEDDGQPDEYTEWQDLYGGDDWDHGQYDEY
jgi:hypothetical protein